jgi:hypothetical protein
MRRITVPSSLNEISSADQLRKALFHPPQPLAIAASGQMLKDDVDVFSSTSGICFMLVPIPLLFFLFYSLACALIVCILGPYYLPGPGCRRPTGGSLLSSPLWEPGETEPRQVCYAFAFLFTSVAYPWHFGTDPDSRIRTSDWRIRMRTREAQ